MAQSQSTLKRGLNNWHGYAIMIGGMIGSGIFVVTGEAGALAGPGVPFGYIMLLPVLLATALGFMIFLSTPLGNQSGGAYLHISRTFNKPFIGFLFIWFQYIALIGVMSIMALSFGEYLVSLTGKGSTMIYATALVLFFYLLNVSGVKWFGRIQLAMTILLMLAILLLVLPGFSFIKVANFQPVLPNGIEGLIAVLPTLFFSYFGFEQIAQAGSEMKDPQKNLPKTMFIGSLLIMGIYFLIAIVAFGVIPHDQLAQSKSAMFDVAGVYLPGFGKYVVAAGIIMAFATTLNSIMMVVSRIMYSLAEERAIPAVFGHINKRFLTPHVALTINAVLVLVLLWTNTMSFLLTIVIQGMFLMYIGHTVAATLLPYVNAELYESALYKPSKKLNLVAGIFAVSILGYFSFTLILSVLPLLLVWTGIGVFIYVVGKKQHQKLSLSQSTKTSY